MDVRCLGSGRPFVFEFINPRKTKFSQAEVLELQNSVNNSTSVIRLRDLQIVDRYGCLVTCDHFYDEIVNTVL